MSMRDVAIRCALASYFGALCGFLSLIQRDYSVQWISACLALVVIAMYQAEKYEQMKYANVRY